MAVSYKQQLVRFYAGGLSLPAISFLALITGFSFSLSLPSSLQALMSAMESLLLVSLRQFWQASLCWITPPCLFVLLNGIIMILTATSSRSFHSRDNEEAGEDEEFSAKLATQRDNVPYRQNVPATMEHVLTDSCEVRSTSASILDDSLQIGGSFDIQNNIPLAQSMHAQSTKKVELETLKGATSCNGHGNGKLYMVGQVTASEHASTTGKAGNKPSALSSSSPLACGEKAKAGSEPSSPHYSSPQPANNNNTRRSSSIDFASFVDNNAASRRSIDSASFANNNGTTSEHLSEDAFKKRIDDFILKMNSKIRSEQ